jgi:hypothetical protein
MGLVNKEIKKKIADIEEISKTSGYIVLDSSVICNLIRTHRDYKNIDYFEELELIKEQVELTRKLKYEIDGNERYVFPVEVRNEIEFSANDYLMRKRKKRRKTGRRKAMKGKNEQEKIDLYSCCKEIGKTLGILIHERRDIVSKMKSLEYELPGLEKSMLPDIERTVLDLSDEFYDRNMKKREKRYSEGKIENRRNDEIILAKSFALSEVNPVTVISKDWDMKEIYSEIYKNLDRFIDNGVPGLPAYNLDLFMMQENEDFQYFNPVMFVPRELKNRFRMMS